MCAVPHLRDLLPGWCEVTFATLLEVEDMLDLLENRGCTEVEMSALGDMQFVVRWRYTDTP